MFFYKPGDHRIAEPSTVRRGRHISTAANFWSIKRFSLDVPGQLLFVLNLYALGDMFGGGFPDPNPTKFRWVFGQCCFHWKGSWKKNISNWFCRVLKGGGCSRGGGNWGIWWIPREDWGTLVKIPIIISRCWKSSTLVSLFWWLGKPNVPKTSASYHPTHIYRMAHGRKLTNKLLQKEKSESQSDCHPLMHSLLAAS